MIQGRAPTASISVIGHTCDMRAVRRLGIQDGDTEARTLQHPKAITQTRLKTGGGSTRPRPGEKTEIHGNSRGGTQRFLCSYISESRARVSVLPDLVNGSTRSSSHRASRARCGCHEAPRRPVRMRSWCGPVSVETRYGTRFLSGTEWVGLPSSDLVRLVPSLRSHPDTLSVAIKISVACCSASVPK